LTTAIVLGTLETQPLLYFPRNLLANVTADTEVEYVEHLKTLDLKLVPSKAPGRRSRHYKIVRHHGSAWTSIPKPWLRYLSPKSGDTIIIEWREATADTVATLTFTRKAAA